MQFDEKTLKEDYIYKGKILKLRRDDVVLPNGNVAIREVVEHSGGAAILCVKNGKALFVDQFRYPYKKVISEIPAGKINVGEAPEETALRELEEEGGLKAKTLKKIADFYPSTGYTDEIIYVYFTDDFTESCNNPDEDEFIEGKWVALSEVKKMISRGEIKDGKTLIAFLWYFSEFGKNN